MNLQYYLTIILITLWSHCLQAETVNFDQQIRPLLVQHCQSCHSEKKHEGGLRLDSKSWTFKGGDSGSALVEKNLELSELYQRIISQDEDLRMPAKGPALSIAQQELFKQWILEGANWTENAQDKLADRDPRLEHWSFQPIKSPVPPKLSMPHDAMNPVDLFILDQSQQAQVPHSALADRRTLIRRAYFDLLGISPSYAQVQAFENDPAPDAYEQLIDQLLASPHYGERYGRHWLDIARYADTMGYNFVNDNRHYFAWTFRDYVIKAMNDDLPYDVFIKDQLAADHTQKIEQDKSSLAALGFLTVGGNFVGDNNGRTDDQIDVITRGLMGLTVQCARCHAHKYDPLSMGDYYALYGVLKSSNEPINFGAVANTITKLPVIAPAGGTAEQIREYELKVEEELKSLLDWDLKTMEEVRAEFKSRAKFYIAKVKKHPGETPFLRDKVLKLYEKVINEDQAYLQKPYSELSEEDINAIADQVNSMINVDNLKKYLIDKEENERSRKEKVLGKLHGSHPGAPIRAMVMYDNEKPYNPVIFLRGNESNRGDNVPRRFIEIFNQALNLEPFVKGSGRAELADAITHPKNPLTSRVIVNRLWLWHFGQGLVRTPGDFGLRGEAPTHPELLDYLATYLMEHDWSIKSVQRLIMTSATYKRSSVPGPSAMSKDPENRLWSHQNTRRLELEPLRDSLFQHTVGLDDTIGGQPVEIFDAPYPAKRTVYGFVDRYKIDQEFRTFDFASVDTSCPQRPFTTVPQQSLFMLNHAMIAKMTNDLAVKIEQLPIQQDAKLNPDAQRIALLYRELFQRDPLPDELKSLESHLQNERDLQQDKKSSTAPWARITQALLMSNEFLFID